MINRHYYPEMERTALGNIEGGAGAGRMGVRNSSAPGCGIRNAGAAWVNMSRAGAIRQH